MINMTRMVKDTSAAAMEFKLARTMIDAYPANLMGGVNESLIAHSSTPSRIFPCSGGGGKKQDKTKGDSKK